MKIDAHHHFWHYNTRDYGWISDEMAVLRRDFLPADLKPELAEIVRPGLEFARRDPSVGLGMEYGTVANGMGKSSEGYRN